MTINVYKHIICDFNHFRPGLLIAVVSFYISLSGCSDKLKSKEELLNFRNAEASLVMSEEGEIIGKFFVENRTNIPFDRIPEHLINALIATEDVRFYEHRGTDTRSYFRVLFKTIIMRDRTSGGGSTLTQQLAKNILGRKSKGVFPVVSAKVREAILAHRIEQVFTKDEIISLYLNTVSFGENIFGIEAASLRYFNKTTGSLKPEESAVLVGMLKANTFFNPRLNPANAGKRRNVVLRQMEKYNYLSKREADSLVLIPMKINYRSETSGPADYFLAVVRRETDRILREVNAETGKKWDPERDGLIIGTTMDIALQNYALLSFSEHLPAMQRRMYDQYSTVQGRLNLDQITEREIERLNLKKRAGNLIFHEVFDWNGNHTDSITVRDSLRMALTLLHAGLIAMDPSSGGIKAWVGGVDFGTQPYDQVLARRQLASVFKPVLYSAALEEGMEPCHYLDNDSIALSGYEDWSPENFDHSFGGKYSMAGALAHSMNIPTISLFLELGFSKVDTMWKRMGFSFQIETNPSLPMGTAEANVEEVAVAYSSFANGGYRITPYCINSIMTPDSTMIFERGKSKTGIRIIEERSSLLMNAMLQKAIREGTGVSVNNIYGVDFPLAGKTGTSQDYSDAWFAAYNPGIVIVSRVGASSRLIHFNNGANGSGSALALPLVALTLQKVKHDRLLAERYATPFPDLPEELAGALDCPDFREKSFFDRIIDIFEKDKKDFQKKGENKKGEIRSFLKRIFRNNKPAEYEKN